MKTLYFITLTLLITLLTSLPAYTQGPALENYDVSGAFYRKPVPASKLSKELKDKLEVSDAEKSEYREIAKSAKGKLAKMWNHPCDYGKVIEANDPLCVSQLKFEAGSAYFFQPEPEYKVAANINTIKDEFRAASFDNTRQLLVDLGEVDLSRINKQTVAVETLNSLPMFGDKDPVSLIGLPEGRRYKDLIISDRQPITLNHTYLLRSMELVQGLGYWRYESIYAFRVVNIKDNVVTFIWKEVDSKIRRLKSPAAN